MGLIPTLSLAGLALALAALFGWLGARPVDIRRGPRLVPWRLLMLASFTMVVAALVHVVTLLHAPEAAGG